MQFKFMTSGWALLNLASAAVSCPPHLSVGKALSGPNQMIIQASEVDEPDRLILDEYANLKKTSPAVVQKTFAATGDLSCADGDGQANLTIVGDVITTAAHMLMNGKAKCVDPKKLNGCKVIFDVEGEKQTYEIESLIDSGRPCPFNKTASKTGTDWAVLRLKKKVDPRVKPYRIDPNFFDTLVDDTPITTVGKSIDFPKTGRYKSLLDRPRHYADCINRSTSAQDFSVDLTTDCDGDHGTSGAGAFKRESGVLGTRPPTLIAVVAGGVQHGNPNCPPATRTQVKGAYSKDCYNEAMTLISGDFKDALERVEKERNSADSIEQPKSKNSRNAPDGTDL